MVSPHPDQLFDAAMQLPPSARAALAERLWQSIDGIVRPDGDTAWDREIERRIEAARRDRSQLIDGEQVMRNLERGIRP